MIGLNDRAELNSRKKMLLWALLSYGLLLMMSYGFPVTGDDWYFYPRSGSNLSFFDYIARAYKIMTGHYETTNGRLLGNFLVSLLGQKLPREIVRCGITLLILLCTFRLSGCRSVSAYLAAFALLIAMPCAVVSQTYTWAAGFFNYVPPTFLVLSYFCYTKGIFCEDRRHRSLGWFILLFLLGLSTQFFMENISVGMCVLSAVVFLTDWIHSKRTDASLAAHLVGAVVGCTVMLLAPGYRNVGTEGYRQLASGMGGYLALMEKNFKLLSYYLTVNNFLVVVPACLSGIVVCIRALSEDAKTKRIPALACMLYFAAFPLICYGIRIFGRYYLIIDFLANLGFFCAIVFSAIFCVRERSPRFVLLISAGTFLVFIVPLFVVSPVGPRNAYFFDVLLILITLTMLRQAVHDREQLRLAAPAVALAACLLLCGNMWIHYKNGTNEHLRNQIMAEALERGDREVTLPEYPYPSYVHAASKDSALMYYYYHDVPGDIVFHFVKYKDWIASR